MENIALLLFGFPIGSDENRKAKARERWERERVRPMQTVTTEREIEIANSAYWLNPPDLRTKYMQEAESARERWPWDERLLIQQMKGDNE